jgi:hypothetical protein
LYAEILTYYSPDKDKTMQHIMSKNEIVYGIRNLNVIERLNIITDIWDEIKESQELEAVSEDEKILLLNRLGFIIKENLCSGRT